MTNLTPNNFLEFFHLQNALDSELIRWGIWAPTFFGHTKSEVKNFSEFFCLQSILNSEFFRGAIWALTFLGHVKFEVKNFLEFFHLQSAVNPEFFTRGGLGTNFFWSWQICGQKFFGIFSFTECSGL